jgi:hypothetical protein
MTKQYRIHIRGEQRDPLDVDLMVQLVIMLGRQLAKEAEEKAARPQHDATETPRPTEPSATQEPDA